MIRTLNLAGVLAGILLVGALGLASAGLIWHSWAAIAAGGVSALCSISAAILAVIDS